MNKIDREKKVVECMIRLYCRKKEGNKTLCNECTEVMDYAFSRLDRCKFGKEKPTCRVCPIHCYKPEMKEKIKTIMRFSGPRLMLYHPIFTFRHTLRATVYSKSQGKKGLIH